MAGGSGQGTTLQQVGPTLFAAGGNAIGSYLGGPVGGAIGGLAGGLIGSLIFGRAKAKPLIPDLNLMTSSYGNPIPILWGTARLGGTVTWLSVLEVKEHGVGKGGLNNTAYSYWQDGAIAFCEGPAHLVRIYLDGKLFLDKTNALGQMTKNDRYHFTIREYNGTEDQLPDYRYNLWLRGQNKDGRGPGYRGLAYLIFQQIDLMGWGGRFPQVSAVWSTNDEFTTFFTKLAPLPGISHDESTVTFLGHGSATDWTRNVSYQISADGTLRAYDLATGLNIATNPFCYPGVAGVSAGNGTYVYLWQLGGEVKIVDPLNLAIIGAFDYSQTIFGLPLSVGVRELHAINLGLGNPGYSVVTGQVGTGDLTVVEMILPSPGIIVIYNDAAQTGQYSNLTFSDLLHRVNIVFGYHDIAKQTTDIWFTNTSDNDGTGTLALWRYTSDTPGGTIQEYGGLFAIRGDTNEAKFVTSFHATDFGLTQDFDAVGSAGIGGLLFDPSDDSIVITDALFFPYHVTFKWDIATEQILWSVVDGAHALQGSAVNWELSQGLGYNTFGIGPAEEGHRTTDVSALNLLTGEITKSPVEPTDGPRKIVGNGNFNSNSNTLVFTDIATNLVWVATIFRKPNVEVPISQIITDICARVDVDSSMIDVSGVTATVMGYVISTPKSAGAALADLCHVFQLDMVESDYILKFIPRGKASAVTITQDDLGSIDPQDGQKYWVPRHTQEQDLPLLINLKYIDFNLDYQPGGTYAKRTELPVKTVFSKRRLSIDLPVIADSNRAKQIAEMWLYTMWAERETYSTVLSAKYLWLDPTDNVTVLLDNGDSFTSRIESTEIGSDFSMRPTLASEDASVYAGSSSPGAEFGRLPQTIIQAPYGELLQFNVPLLQDTDDLGNVSTRVYFAVGASTAGWGGGALYNSIDGATWTSQANLPRNTGWGHAVSVLGDTVAAFATDYVNTVIITMAPGGAAPSSCTYLDLMNGVNPVLVGEEIIQFQTITDLGDGRFELSVLARGRRGTEWACGGHRSGDLVVFLEAGNIGGARLPIDQVNLRELWRLTPTGWFLDQALARSFTYKGYDLMPYAPVNFTRAVAGSDLLLGWLRRTRMGGLLADGIDTVPLNEQSEGYEAYILDGAAQFENFNPMPSAVAHRYWRLIMSTKSPGVTRYGMAEVEFRDVAGTPRSFSGGTATDTPSSPPTPNDPSLTHSAPKAIDGNPATWWVSAFDNADWWMYDYGVSGSLNVVEVVVTAPSDISVGNGPVDFALEYSDDNVTWIATENFHHETWTAGQTVRFGPYRRAYRGLTTPFLTYAAADMATDGFDPDTDTVSLVVYQTSAVIGRGFPGFEELPAF